MATTGVLKALARAGVNQFTSRFSLLGCSHPELSLFSSLTYLARILA